MSARRSRSAALLAALALTSACRIGDPLVDRLSPPQRGPVQGDACEEPPPCEEPTTSALALTEPKRLKWQGCPIKCDGTSADSAIASGDRPLSLDCIPIDPLDDLATALECATKRVTSSATTPTLSAGGHIGVKEMVWKSSNVLIEADAPLEITFSRAELRDTRVDLSGPITLRFQDDTKLTRVSISSDSHDARLILDGVDATELIAGDAARPFAGHLGARHSAWSQASVVVESLELDSVMIEESFIAATDLVSGDGALTAVRLEVGHATFAPSALAGVAITACESLSFFGSDLRSVSVARCSGEPTRIYDSDVNGAWLDGKIHGDSSMLESVSFGSSAPSELELWGVSVLESTFCDHVESVKVSGNAVLCSDCSDAFDPAEKPCMLPSGDFDTITSATGGDQTDASSKSNFCEALNFLEPCPPPVPMRMRPIGTLDRE